MLKPMIETLETVEQRYSLTRIDENTEGWRLFYFHKGLYFSPAFLKYSMSGIKFSITHSRDKLFLWVKPECYQEAEKIRSLIEDNIVQDIEHSIIISAISEITKLGVGLGEINHPDKGFNPPTWTINGSGSSGWYY